MKRLIINSVLLLVGALLFMPNVDAATGSLSVSCDKQNVVPGDTITCSLSATTDFPVYDMEIPFTLSTGLTALDFVLSSTSNMMGGGVDGGKIGISTSSNIPAGTFALGTFTVKAGNDITNGSATITFNNIKFSENEDTEHSIPDSTITLNSSIPTGLKLLGVTGGTLAPQFTVSNKVYMVTLNSSTTVFSIQATAANSSDAVTLKNVNTDATYTVDGDITFEPAAGQSSMSINVIVGTGSTQETYNINVQRAAPPVTSGELLSSLSVNGRGVTLRNDSSATENVSVSVNQAGNYQIVATLSDSADYAFEQNGLCTVSGATMTCNTTATNFAFRVYSTRDGGGPSKTYNLTINVVSSPSNVGSNPQTGTGAFMMAIVLMLSLITSLYLYKKNINGYN